jgi:hypothetical protein
LANNNPVSHPKHYTFSKLQVIDAIEAWGLNFHLGNTVKYIARAGRKDVAKEVEDLEKAVWYLQRHIENISKANENPAPAPAIPNTYHDNPLGESDGWPTAHDNHRRL